jgi:hypothetical protein
VKWVSIYYLPRNAVSLDNGIPWYEPYNRGIAERALHRVNHLHTQITVLRELGEGILDQWITGLPRANGCHDCARFPDNPTQPVPESIDDALGTP